MKNIEDMNLLYIYYTYFLSTYTYWEDTGYLNLGLCINIQTHIIFEL